MPLTMRSSRRRPESPTVTPPQYLYGIVAHADGTFACERWPVRVTPKRYVLAAPTPLASGRCHVPRDEVDLSSGFSVFATSMGEAWQALIRARHWEDAYCATHPTYHATVCVGLRCLRYGLDAYPHATLHRREDAAMHALADLAVAPPETLVGRRYAPLPLSAWEDV
jgi:hypothetical protein